MQKEKYRDMLIRNIDAELKRKFFMLCIKQKTNMTAKIKAMIKREVESTLENVDHD